MYGLVSPPEVSDPLITRVHEAGHAVVVHVLGMRLRYVSVVPNDERAYYRGSWGLTAPHASRYRTLQQAHTFS